MKTAAKRLPSFICLIKLALVLIPLTSFGYLLRKYNHYYELRPFREHNKTPRAIFGPPKVALLFLSKGALYHQKFLSRWLTLSSNALPLSYVEHACRNDYNQLIQLSKQHQCKSSKDNNNNDINHVKFNNLFSTYIHIPPSAIMYPNTSLFKDSIISNRISTAWGDNSLMQATKSLLIEALKNPLNKVFILLSETDIPLYDPFTLYMQLMSEEKSRVNACFDSNHPEQTFPWRWSPQMSPVINQSQWRKSSQWFSLKRKHAQLIVDDYDVFNAFIQYCQPHKCIADEHYVPTLMAVLNLENEMACDTWGISSVDWSRGGAHPKTYFPHEINKELIEMLRSDTPHIDEYIRWSKKQFLYDCSEASQPHVLCGKRLNTLLLESKKAVDNNDGQGLMVRNEYYPKMTARKFDWHSILLVDELFDYIVGS